MYNPLIQDAQWMSGPANFSTPGGPQVSSSGNTVVIDGTPVRVVVLALSAAVGLAALKMAGFRFNVGVNV